MALIHFYEKTKKKNTTKILRDHNDLQKENVGKKNEWVCNLRQIHT